MASHVAVPTTVAPPVELFDGLAAVSPAGFEEPYPDDQGG
jgi:hypothetical protein